MSAADDAIDPYRILGIPEDADDEQVRRAWREACFRYHPDTGGDAADPERLVAVQQAFDSLSDPARRARIDRQRRDRKTGDDAAASQDGEPPILSAENIRLNVEYLGGELRRAWSFLARVFRD